MREPQDRPDKTRSMQKWKIQRVKAKEKLRSPSVQLAHPVHVLNTVKLRMGDVEDVHCRAYLEF